MSTRLPMPPAEWADQETLLIGWPSHNAPWGAPFEAAREEIAALVHAIHSTSTKAGRAVTKPVLVLEGDEAEASAMAALPGVDLINMPVGDTWLRDTAPIFTTVNNGLAARRFRFNGWGGKYIYPGDAELSERLSHHFGIETEVFDVVLEGGSLDWDGAGLVLTTRDCLLNANRNPDWSEDSATEFLKDAFDFDEVIWLGDGLVNDHTDGHVDNVARFVGPGHVVCQTPSDDQDPHKDVLEKVYSDLVGWRGRNGARLKVSTVPSPGRVLDEDGEVMPASHMNFVITNQLVIVPVYNDQGVAAVEALGSCFQDRDTVGLPANAILTGGGAFHCITQQMPAVRSVL